MAKKETLLPINEINKDTRFALYFASWVNSYKKGVIQRVTMSKYRVHYYFIEEFFPDVTCGEINRTIVQEMINQYAAGKGTPRETPRAQATVKDFF